MLRSSIPLIHTGDSKIGWMEEDEWNQVKKILYDEGVLKKDIDVHEAYTMKFLEKIYVE